MIPRSLPIALTLALLAGCGSDQPPRGDFLNFCISAINGTPVTGCPTPTGDLQIIRNCPGFSPTIEIINGTPYVILAAACTPTPTPFRTPTSPT